ncbi:MAG: nuclear transport factor 2 family protein [Akkermansiaceae bacterium]
MNIKILLALALACTSQARAEEFSPDIAGLQQAAADFVTAYNKRDAAAIAALFTEEGEMADITGTKLTSGRGEIQARYEEIFDGTPALMALEVGSVRIVAANLAIEDGIVHITPAADEEHPPRSFSYTAVLMKNAENIWQIASTRDLADVTTADGNLAELANTLKGEWTSRTSDGVQLDLAFGWDATGKSVVGETLTTTADSEPQTGSVRLGWNAAKKSIVSWIFDAKGGVTEGVWTPTAGGWLVRVEGTTAEGETITLNQKLTAEGENTLIWSATNRVVNGELQPDTSLRIARQAPEPSED